MKVSKFPYSNFVPKQIERTPEYTGNSCACPFRIFLIVSIHWIVHLRSPCKQEVVLEEIWVIISYGCCDTLILQSNNLSFRKSRVDYWSVCLSVLLLLLLDWSIVDLQSCAKFKVYNIVIYLLFFSDYIPL